MPTRRLFIRAAVPGGVGFAANGLIAGLALLAVTLVVPSLPGLIAASVVMGVLLWGMDVAAAPLYAGPFITRSAALIIIIGIAVVAFFVMALVFGAADWREVKQRAALLRRPRSTQT